MKRRVGRPRKAVVSRGHVLRATLDIVEKDGLAGVTMRVIAKRIKADPMAIYHYFEDRHEVLCAAAGLVFESIEVPAATGWRRRLEALSIAYVELVATWGELLRYLITSGESASRIDEPVKIFHARFVEAIGSLDVKAMASSALVDFLHGYAMVVPRTGLDTKRKLQLARELEVLIDGMRA